MGANPKLRVIIFSNREVSDYAGVAFLDQILQGCWVIAEGNLWILVIKL